MNLLQKPSFKMPGGPGQKLGEIFSFVDAVAANATDPVCKAQPYAAGTGLRLSKNQYNGVGFAEVVRLDTDCYAIMLQSKLAKDATDKLVGDDWITFAFEIQDSTATVFGEICGFSHVDSVCTILSTPQGFEWAHRGRKGESQVSLSVSCKPRFLTKKMRLHPDQMLRPLSRLLRGDPPEFFFRAIPMTAEMTRATLEAMNTDFTREMRRAYLKAKVCELLCLACSRFNEAEHKPVREIRLNARDVKNVNHAREILDESYVYPRNVTDLARTVGLNRTKLFYGFKEVYGVTMSEYCFERRMEHALDLLFNKQLQIAQVAYAVGYAHPTNFTVAFKNYFGALPRSFLGRRQAEGPVKEK